MCSPCVIKFGLRSPVDQSTINYQLAVFEYKINLEREKNCTLHDKTCRIKANNAKIKKYICG